MQDDNNGESKKKELLHKTIWWLKENYSFVEGFSISRQTIYENYQSYCKNHKYLPISTATFGKIIRQQFPQITTRRLGIRGHSKYHYHGLAVKETSVYYDSKNMPNISVSLMKISPATNIQHPKDRNDSVPKIQLTIDIFKNSANEERLNLDMGNFFIMYQTHSQQILDSIFHGSFEEIEKYLLSFWKSCPEHFIYLFDNSSLIDGVIIVDIQVYIAVYRFVLYSMNQSLPDIYMKQFITFLNNYSTILFNVIPETYIMLRDKKLFYATMFKQMCFTWFRGSHLYQLIFPIFCTTDCISQILNDFQTICLEYIIEDTVHAFPNSSLKKLYQHFYIHFENFENLLEVDFSFDSILKWIQNIFQNKLSTIEFNPKDYFLYWSIFFSKFLREMLLNTAESFGQANLVFLWLQHLFYTESIMCEFKSVILSLNKLHGDQILMGYFQNHDSKSISSQVVCHSKVAK